MASEKMTVVGYARVSTENQLENYSIDEQLERLKNYCAAKGWVLLKSYVDAGYSGGNLNRPALQQMLQAIRDGRIDAVVVYKLDRLSRSQKDTMALIEDEFLCRGTDFVSINENFDTSTPFGRAMIGILSVFAQLEKDQITERFTMGRIGRSKAGYYHGGSSVPTGYDYRDGLLTINPYEAQQVQLIFRMFLSGSSLHAIYRNLKENYTTYWSPSKVRSIIKNDLFTGKVHFDGVTYDGLHQPLIDADTWREANYLLSSSAREQAKTPAQKTPYRAKYLLSSLVFCARCGARYSANHGYYKCYSRSKSCKDFIKDPNCKNDNWALGALDRVVIGQIDDLVADPEAVQSLIHRANNPKTAAAVDKSQLKRQADDIDRQIDRLLELYQVSAIPMDVLTRRIHDLDAQKQGVLSSMNAVDTEQTSAAQRFLDSLAAYASGFQSAGLEQRRLLISCVVSKVVIDGPSVSVEWRV